MSDMNGNQTVYPIDVRTLKKGDYIKPEFIEKTYECKRENNLYSLNVLKLRSFIEQASRNEDEPLLTKGEKFGIRILIDSEAVEYTNSRAENAKNQLAVALAKMTLIDKNNLDEKESGDLERNVEVNSKRLLAMDTSDKELKAAQHRRTLPTLEDK